MKINSDEKKPSKKIPSFDGFNKKKLYLFIFRCSVVLVRNIRVKNRNKLSLQVEKIHTKEEKNTYA